MKTLRAILTVMLTCAGVGSLHAQAVNGIKAVVHNSVITFHEVDVLTAPMADVLRRQYRAEPEVFQQKITQAVDENLDQLVERQLILHDFETEGYNLPDSIIDEVVQERIRTRFGDRANFAKSLKAEGITFEKFRKQVRDQFVIEALRGKNISSEIMISPTKLENYYKEHQDKYKVEDEIKLRMIVMRVPSPAEAAQKRQLADNILAKIKGGATFTEMASVYSEGSQRSQGGDWGWVERSVLRKDLADAAFALNTGEVSGVIESGEAFYLMLVEEKRPAHVKPLNEVRDEIEKGLLSQEQTRLEKQWVDRLKKKTFIRFF
jgi:peptidyl-prolyl cis-trans isomerase SurA